MRVLLEEFRRVDLVPAGFLIREDGLQLGVMDEVVERTEFFERLSFSRRRGGTIENSHTERFPLPRFGVDLLSPFFSHDRFASDFPL